MTTRSYRTTPGALHARTDATHDDAKVDSVLVSQGVDLTRSYSATSAIPIGQRELLYRAEFARCAHDAPPSDRVALATIVARLQASPSPTTDAKVAPAAARTDRGTRAAMIAAAGNAWRDTAPDDDEPASVVPTTTATGDDAARKRMHAAQRAAWKIQGGGE